MVGDAGEHPGQQGLGVNAVHLGGFDQGILCDYSHNDLAAGKSLAEIQTTMTDIWGMFHDDGYAIHHTTSLPRVAGTFLTTAGQAPSTDGDGFVGGTGSIRHQFNEWIRTLPAPLAGYVETSDAVDVDADNIFSSGAGYWLSGNAGIGATNVHLTTTGAATDRATGEGTHPVNSHNSDESGGHFILRDTFADYLDAL